MVTNNLKTQPERAAIKNNLFQALASFTCFSLTIVQKDGDADTVEEQVAPLDTDDANETVTRSPDIAPQRDVMLAAVRLTALMNQFARQVKGPATSDVSLHGDRRKAPWRPQTRPW